MDSWETEIIGTNSKLSEQDCAHLLVRTKYLDAWQKRRREIRLYYLDRFKDLNFRCLSRDFPVHADQKFAIYTPTNRDDLQLFLGDAGIETRIHYKSTISEHPIAKNIENKPDMLSTGTMLSRGLLSLPIFPEMTDTEVEYVADRVRNFF
jgi:dTDP-4-amino-4,6-dideoxygalactose transaminase